MLSLCFTGDNSGSPMTDIVSNAPGAGASAMSSRQIAWVFELTVQAGKEADFRALMAEMAEATERNEPLTIDYEWYVSADGQRVHVLERYADADAAMIHLGTFGERYMARFFDVFTPQRMTVYGAPDDRVRGVLSQLAPEVMLRAAGFGR